MKTKMQYYRVHFQSPDFEGQRFELVEVNPDEGEKQAIFSVREYLKHKYKSFKIICAAYYGEFSCHPYHMDSQSKSTWIMCKPGYDRHHASLRRNAPVWAKWRHAYNWPDTPRYGHDFIFVA